MSDLPGKNKNLIGEERYSISDMGCKKSSPKYWCSSTVNLSSR